MFFLLSALDFKERVEGLLEGKEQSSFVDGNEHSYCLKGDLGLKNREKLRRGEVSAGRGKKWGKEWNRERK